ncbi:hypothetical protein [Erwinia piriflorinigrans]|uniref:hypothetical protein n=1 Tax=Erwinia piriflorinigrans TaxID=665097 RepID=UPI000661677B|nr:hypothetical protein [Erwinia piriflorinigrans]
MCAVNAIKIKHLLQGSQVEDIYNSDGHDDLNGILEYLADKYVPVQPIEAQPRGGARNLISKRNLIENGVSSVAYFDDVEEVWVELQDQELTKV